jgi:serine/threonine-protein kinase HipA
MLHGQQIGNILQRGDVARFVFDDDYWSNSNRSVLGAWFEDNPRQSPQASQRLPPWFSNLLPEGRLREWVARERGVNAARELQLMLHIGADLPGAVEVISHAGDLAGLDAIHAPLADWGTSSTQNTVWKFSLAGVGLKFSMLRDGDKLTIPGSDALGDWIVKFPDAIFADLPHNEYGIMKLAGRVGIQIPEIALVHRDSLPPMPDALWPSLESEAYAVRRFDRTPERGRIHIEDFAQVRNWYSEAKYDGSLSSVAALCFRGTDHWSLQEFVRRMTYNLLVGNGDAHLKNWSFIYPDGRVAQLSPAYDLVSTASFLPKETLGLKFNGVREFSRVNRSAFERLQQRLDVDSTDVLDVLDETTSLFFEAWSDRGDLQLPRNVVNHVDANATKMRNQLSP